MKLISNTSDLLYLITLNYLFIRIYIFKLFSYRIISSYLR